MMVMMVMAVMMVGEYTHSQKLLQLFIIEIIEIV